MAVSRRLLAAFCGAALAAATGLAADAGAATITTTIPCVRNIGIPGGLTLPLAGAGFSPNASVLIRTATAADPTAPDLTTLQADAAGNLVSRVDPPPLHASSTVEQDFTLAAVDRSNPLIIATLKFRQVRFGFDAKPSTGRPTRKVTYTARGFLPGKPIYAHFRFAGLTRRDVRIGVADSPCGIASKRMRLLPTKTRFGTWTVYMDQSRKYVRGTLLQAKGSLTINRTLT
jgi:hypothetical protein